MRDEDVWDGVAGDALSFEDAEHTAEAGAELSVRAVAGVEQYTVAGGVLEVHHVVAEGDLV